MNLEPLRQLLEPTVPADPVVELEELAKSLVPVPEVWEPVEEPTLGPLTAAKVREDADLDTISRLLSQGAQRDGKRLVLDLGKAGRVAYTPHQADWVAKSERGSLEIDVPDHWDALDRLSLTEFVEFAGETPDGEG